jgi:5'-3' exonuclease
VRVACEDHTVHKVFVLTPDKDLGQVVQGKRVVQMDRRNNVIIDEDAVKEKFGVGPSSIADYLGLVGDSADGFPGLQGWGAKSASTLLAKYGTIDNIPDSYEQWVSDGVAVRGAEKLATTLRNNRTEAQLFKTLATLVSDVEVGEISDWKWNGPTSVFADICQQLNSEHLLKKLELLK